MVAAQGLQTANERIVPSICTLPDGSTPWGDSSGSSLSEVLTIMDLENTRLDKGPAPENGAYLGKEGNSDQSPHKKDILAAVVIIVLSLFVMILAVQMPNPRKISTHPGLLPFIIGFTLIVMAIGLGVRAIRLGGAKNIFKAPAGGIQIFFTDSENLRTLLVIGIIILYVILVGLIGFDLELPLGFFVFNFSSFELISIIVLTIILQIFWRATLIRCTLVSACWIIALVSVFRYAFHILLPGLG